MFALLASVRHAAPVRAHVSSAAPSPTLTGTLAYIADADVWTRSGAVATRVTTGGGVTAVRWSPGGSWLLLTRSGNSLAITPDGSHSVPIAGAWLPDDSAVATATSDGGIDLTNPMSGVKQPLIAGNPGLEYLPVVWSADGLTLALIRRPLNQKGLPVSESTWLVQRDGQHLRSLVAAGLTWPRPVGWSPDGRYLAIMQGPAELCVSCRADGQRMDIVSVDGSVSYTIGTVMRPDWLSWAPDSTVVVASAGSGRETYRNKSLTLLNLGTGLTTAIAAESGFVEIQPVFAPDGRSYAFTRGPAVAGIAFTNLDGQHGYPAAVTERRIRLSALDGRVLTQLAHAEGNSEEAPRWTGPDSLLFVRWQPSPAGDAPPTGQIWLADTTTGAEMLIAESFGTATSNVGYYGALGWSSAFAWRP